MATNKHATIRYHALDRCFSNHGRKFFIEDLIDACNEAIYDFAGKTDGVKRRQVFDDITFMESSQGWEIPLDRIKDGRRVYYHYSDRSFSIKNQGLNQSEAVQLRETLSILSRFKGLPHFEWVEEMQIRLEDTFKLKGDIQALVGFEQNPYLKGLQHFTPLFNAIQNKQALSIQYQGFRQENPSEFVFHPWFLKQYNNRWFLFGLRNDYQKISNLSIDRIISISISDIYFISNDSIDFNYYFEDVVGVSVDNDNPPQRVRIRINNTLWPYIQSKPLHGSQKIKIRTNQYVEIELNVQINYELRSLLFSLMDEIEVIEPLSFRILFKSISESLLNKYIY